MLIRAFEEADRQAVIELWQRCGLVVPQNNPGKDIDRKLGVDRELFLVGLEQDQLVATVMGGYEGHRGWINYLAVCPQSRRKGYGKTMMQAIETAIAARGCPKINLQVRSTNREVIAFYTALGYNVEDVLGLGKRLEHD